jgi:cyclase
LHFPASPADALPQQTFSTSQKLQANSEIVMLQYFQPAHTDTDIYTHFQKANVIDMGEPFFNGFYPLIDASTGGKINGMILAADKILPLADNNTQIVPGHGPLGNKADLTKYRDMLVVARDRVQKLKTAGKLAGEIAASKPSCCRVMGAYFWSTSIGHSVSLKAESVCSANRAGKNPEPYRLAFYTHSELKSFRD